MGKGSNLVLGWEIQKMNGGCISTRLVAYSRFQEFSQDDLQ
jgi:hypothetical protein